MYDLTALKGSTKGRVFATTSQSGGPDGLKCDSAGNVWVCEDEGLLVFNPKGQRRTTVVLPESPSNCAFAHQGSTLFVNAKNFRLCGHRLPGDLSRKVLANQLQIKRLQGLDIRSSLAL